MSLHSSSRWRWWAYAVVGVLVVACACPLAYGSWEYVRWRNRMIEWDFGTIERLCGGETEAERLVEIWFIRPWEYKALKKTRDGRQVWIYWRLSTLLKNAIVAFFNPRQVRSTARKPSDFIAGFGIASMR